MNHENWIESCAVDDIDEEDVIRFDYGEKKLSRSIVRTRTNFTRPTATAPTKSFTWQMAW